MSGSWESGGGSLEPREGGAQTGVPASGTPPAPSSQLPAAVRPDFPILARPVHGKRLAFLDNAASTQKPRQVVGAMTALYETGYANVHRGLHHLSELATAAYEGARARVARHVGATEPDEIVFTRGTTEAINLVANSFGRSVLAPGSRIVVTELEHHANIVPWQLVAAATGATVVACPISDDGEVDLEAWVRLLDEGAAIAACGWISNALGTVNPIEAMVRAARERGIPVLVDGAQALPHAPINVQRLGADFLAMSAHKAYGPTGIGALWARRERLAGMPPWQGGGDMIEKVSFAGTTFAPPPSRFEAGTPAIAEAVGFAAALDYIDAIGLDRIAAHEHRLTDAIVERLDRVPGVRIVGRPRERAGVVSFVVDGVHAHDVGQCLDAEGVAVRVGHHCAQPLMDRLGLPATVRASVALYNDLDDVDQLVAGLGRVREVFA